MTTQYTHVATIAVPEAMIDDANQLAAALGRSLDDLNTYKLASYTDGTNNYAVVSPAVNADFLYRAGSGTLTRPSFDETEVIDMVAAGNALIATVIVTRPSGEDVFTPVLPSTDKIVAYVDFDVVQALAYMNLKTHEQIEAEAAALAEQELQSDPEII